MAVKTVSFEEGVYRLSYELLHPQNSKTILFLHGWGSNKEAMKIAFGGYFKAYQHIYVDLPGFGHSSLDAPMDTTHYVKIISKFLQELECTPLMVFGHSFGGKIATLLNPEVLVLLSSAGIVVPKSFKIRTKIWIYKTLKPLFPQSFYRFFATKDVEGMNKMMYEVLKKVVNEDFSSIFSQTKAKTVIYWGKEDTATPLKSGELIHSLIKNSHFFPMMGDHFFFLKNGKNIEKSLLELVS